MGHSTQKLPQLLCEMPHVYLTDFVARGLLVPRAPDLALFGLDLVHLELELLQHGLLHVVLLDDALLVKLFHEFRPSRSQDTHGFGLVDHVEEVVALEESHLQHQECEAQAIPDHAHVVHWLGGRGRSLEFLQARDAQQRYVPIGGVVHLQMEVVRTDWSRLLTSSYLLFADENASHSLENGLAEDDDDVVANQHVPPFHDDLHGPQVKVATLPQENEGSDQVEQRKEVGPFGSSEEHDG